MEEKKHLSPLQPQDPRTKKAIQAIKDAGIEGFVLGFSNGESISITFNQIKMKQAFQVVLSAIHQAIELEIRNNPNYPPDHQKALQDFGTEINMAVKRINEKLKP